MDEMINYGDLEKMESILKTRHNYDEHQRNEGRVGHEALVSHCTKLPKLTNLCFPKAGHFTNTDVAFSAV